MTHQVFRSSALSARASMLPSDTTSTGSPRPMKLRVASMIMPVLTLDTIMNSTADITLGMRCLRRIRKNDAPMQRAASR